MGECPYGYMVPTEFFLRGAKKCPFVSKDDNTVKQFCECCDPKNVDIKAIMSCGANFCAGCGRKL